MLISSEVTKFSTYAAYTVSPLFTLERSGSTVSMTVAASANGYYDDYYGYWLWDGDIYATLGTQEFYDYQYYDRPLDAFVEETLTAGAATAGSYEINYASMNLYFEVTIFDAAANFTGTAGSDFVFGSEFADTLTGGAGVDGFEGAGGDDIINGGSGGDIIDGGAGSDTASYRGSKTGATVYLTNSVLNADAAAGDVLISIENLAGGGHGDNLHGSNAANWIAGKNGDDAIFGLAGNDVLDGGNGRDAIFGGRGNDTLMGGAGADILDGGDGTDTASFAWAKAGVVANLSGKGPSLGDAAGDTFISIENLTGSRFNDRLTGDNLGNVIDGGAGNDVINGGDGIDVLSGGSGKDAFVFSSNLDSMNNVDFIVDYSAADDVIRLDNGVFQGLAAGGLAASAFVVGSAAQTADQHIIYNLLTGELSYDADGSGATAAIVFARLFPGQLMSEGEFAIF